MSTFLQLQDEVLSHQFSDTKYRDYIKQWLNEGQAFVCAQTDFRGELASQSVSTTAGTQTAALNSNFARMVSVRNTTDDNFLNRISLRDFDDLSDSSGKPLYYVVIGTNLTFYPTPDATYSLSMRYYKLPATLTANGDTPEIPSHYQHLLVRYALIRCYQRENDYDAATYQTGEFEKGLMKMRTEVQHDTFDQPEQVEGPFGVEVLVDNATWW